MFRATLTKWREKTLDLKPLTPVVFGVSEPRTEVVLFHFQHFTSNFMKDRPANDAFRHPRGEPRCILCLDFMSACSVHHKPHFRLIGWPVPSFLLVFPSLLCMHLRDVPFRYGFLSVHYRLILFYIWQRIWRPQAYSDYTHLARSQHDARFEYNVCSDIPCHPSHVCFSLYPSLYSEWYEYRFRQCFLIKPFLVASPSSHIHSQSLRWCDRRV